MSEQVRILRYSAPGGHGYTAEDANNINDILRGMSSEIIGTSNELNGPDRVSNVCFFNPSIIKVPLRLLLLRSLILTILKSCKS